MDVSTTIFTIPAGLVLDFAGSSAPSGFLNCDGSLISRTTYARLFETIGTTYGAGDGSTTFKLPDLRGRTSVGAGAGSGLTSRTLAATGGEETHLLSESEMPTHTHIQDVHSHSQLLSNTGGGAIAVKYDATATTAIASAYAASTSVTATNQNTGGGTAHNNMQPYTVLNKIIKY